LQIQKSMYLCSPILKEIDERELSSAGSEHLPYKQGVTGSNPVAPTHKAILSDGFFCSHLLAISNIFNYLCCV